MIALLLVALVFAGVGLILAAGFFINHETGQRTSGARHWATFHPEAPLELPGPVAAVSPAPQRPQAGPGTYLDPYRDRAWLTAGVNARTRCWVPDMRDTATAWDRRNAAELRAILDRADTNLPWINARFQPIEAQARKSLAAPL